MHCRLKSKSREHPKSRRWTQSHVKWQHSRGWCWRHRKRLWEKECRPLPEARRARKRILPQLPSRSNTSPTHFRLLTSWTVQWWIYVVLSHCMLSKSLQSCPAFCNPIDCSPPGSSVHGDSPGKNSGVGCCFLLQGIFPPQGPNPHLLTSPALASWFFTTSTTWEDL